MNYVTVIEKADKGYSAYLPGCIAAGDTIEDTEDLIQEAVEYHLEMLRENGDLIPEPLTRTFLWRQK